MYAETTVSSGLQPRALPPHLLWFPHSSQWLLRLHPAPGRCGPHDDAKPYNAELLRPVSFLLLEQRLDLYYVNAPRATRSPLSEGTLLACARS